MNAWWENTQYRAGVAAMGVLTVGFATALAAAAVLNPSDGPSWGVVVFVPLVLLVVLLAGVILVLRPWRYAADITAMRAGNAWVHWTYDDASWKAANRYDERRTTLWTRGALAVMGLGGFVLLLSIPGGERTLGGSVFGGVLIFMAAIFLTVLLLGEPVRNARRAARGEIYISRHGIYRRPGGYMPIDFRNGIKYESADLVDRPTPHIHIEISVQNTGWSSGWIRKTLTDVGVPPGHEDEARALVELLHLHVLTPRPPERRESHMWAPRQPLDGGPDHPR